MLRSHQNTASCKVAGVTSQALLGAALARLHRAGVLGCVMQDSKIEWCDDTVNAWIGCSKVSAGCANCYADALDNRIGGYGKQRNWGVGAPRYDRSDKAVAEIASIARRAEKDGRPRFVFLSSMCDIFEGREDVIPWRAKVWAALQKANADGLRIVALTLTKRPEGMLAWQREVAPQGLPHWAWVGTSVEHQDAADERIPVLVQVRTAGIRFLSMEPLLNRIERLPLDGVGWVIVGGESGQKARPMHQGWVRDIRNMCVQASVAFLFKQWGEWGPVNSGAGGDIDFSAYPNASADTPAGFFDYCDRWNPAGTNPFRQSMARVGKKAAGRLLDGMEHNGRPSAVRQ